MNIVVIYESISDETRTELLWTLSMSSKLFRTTLNQRWGNYSGTIPHQTFLINWRQTRPKLFRKELYMNVELDEISITSNFIPTFHRIRPRQTHPLHYFDCVNSLHAGNLPFWLKSGKFIGGGSTSIKPCQYKFSFVQLWKITTLKYN